MYTGNQFSSLRILIIEEAVEDADKLIVDTALGLSKEHSSVMIVGEDVDLLVLLTALGPNHTNIFLRKPGRGNIREKVFTSSSLAKKYNTPNIIKYLLVLHAFSGCDTTSAPYNLGKMKILNTLLKNPHLSNIFERYLSRKTLPNIIAVAGSTLFTALYGGNPSKKSLNELRYQCYARLSIKSKANMASLPPTEDAARYHSYRVYHQVQTWLGNTLDPEDWGWKRTAHGLIPISMSQEIAPKNLLKAIRCRCMSRNCTNACGCRKAGLKCSVLCDCDEEKCANKINIEISEPDDIETNMLFAEPSDVDIDHENECLINALKSMQTPQDEVDTQSESDSEDTYVSTVSGKRRKLL